MAWTALSLLTLAGSAAVLLFAARQRRRASRASGKVRGRHDISLMAAGDAQAREFVVQGYADIQVTEGKVASEEELREIGRHLELLATSSTSGVLLCRLDGELAGYLWYVGGASAVPFGPGCYTFQDKPYVWVHTVYTSPRFRRRGVAIALYAELDAVARRARAAEIWCDVYDSNAGSVVLHRGLGYKPVTTIYTRVIESSSASRRAASASS